MICAWNAALPPLWAGHATGVAPAEGLALGLMLGLGEGDGGGVVGEGRATVGVGVGTAVAGTAVVVAGVTDTGVHPATTSKATAHNRRERAFTVHSV